MTGMLNAAVGRSSLRFLAMGSDPLLGFVLVCRTKRRELQRS